MPVAKVYNSNTGQWEPVLVGDTGPAGADATLTKSIRTETADTTLLAADANQIIRFNGTTAQTLTVPDVLSVGQRVEIVQDNSGSVEVVSGSGVTLLSTTGGFGLTGQNAKTELVCVAAGEYRLYGDVATVALDVEYLVIAGGGGAGSVFGGGGGGGGGLISASAVKELQVDYSISVGAGGPGAPNEVTASNGSNSTAFGEVALGGGGGASRNTTASDGGSGGGAGRTAENYIDIAGGSGLQPTSADGGFGNNGGRNGTDNILPKTSGGGGGAGAAGGNGIAQTSCGDGGAGLDYSGTFGSSVGENGYFAGGGGGGGDGTAGTGGLGGGGNGNTSGDGQNGQVNTGGGAGGAGGGSSNDIGGDGGSGIVILRYPSTFTITIGAGLTGTETTVGDNKVATITAGTGNVSWS